MRRTMTLGLLAILLALPLAAPAAGDNPLKEAKPGQWVLYRTMGGMQQKQTVVKVEPDAVTIRVEMIMNGRTMNTAENRIPLSGGMAQAPTNAPDVKQGSSTVTVKGQNIECMTFEGKAQGQTFKTYISRDIPVYGMVRSEMGGQVIMELVDWGE